MSSERSQRPEFPKYYVYDSRWDTWKVYFTNKAALSVSKVKEFFSKYGEVVRIDEVGRDFCFVHFTSRDDAKTCSWSMRDSSSIRLRPFKPKDGQKGHSSDYSDDKNGKNEKQSISENVKSIGDENGRKIQKNNDIPGTSKPSISYELCSSSTSALTESISLDSKAVDNLPDLVEKISVGCSPVKVIQLSIPPPMTWARPRPPILRNVELQDVVVANIHEACGIAFILEMLEGYRPVCASEMEVISEYPLRYCHVYFETAEQAREVEYVYDNTELFGRKLIVQRPDMLAVNAGRLPQGKNGKH